MSSIAARAIAYNFPQVRYQAVPLRGGWDLITPVLSLKPGFVRDVINFECAPAGGYSRIGGYERFDGKPSPSAGFYQIVQVATFTNTPSVGATITQATSSATGYIVALGSNYMAVTKVTGIFDTTHSITISGPTTVGTAVSQSVVITALQDAQYTALAADAYRADIGYVPGSGPVRGVVGANFSGTDYVYAFRDNAGGTAVDLYKATSGGWSQVSLPNEIGFAGGVVSGVHPVTNWTIHAGQPNLGGVLYDNGWKAVCWCSGFGSGLFIAVGSGITANGAALSQDGTNWAISPSVIVNNSWSGVAYRPGGNVVAVANTGSAGTRVMLSADGYAWTTVSSYTNELSWNSVCYSPELFLFVAVASSGTGNRVMTSPDGNTWTARSTPNNNDWNDVIWAKELGKFVAVASSGVGNRVMTSADGINWTARTSSDDSQWSAVAWSPELNLLAAIASDWDFGEHGIMTSPDGINWTNRISPTNNVWNDIAWASGIFVAVASSGSSGNFSMQSADGINWVSSATPSDISWNSLAYSSTLGLFAAVSSTGSTTAGRVMTTTATVAEVVGDEPVDGATLTQGAVSAIVSRIVVQSGTWVTYTSGRFIIGTPSGGSFAVGGASLSGGATVVLTGANTAIALTPGGKFEFCQGNFSGQLSTLKLYGCDGVNRAFEFDGTTLVPISTGTSPDQPKHIVVHRNYLIVGIQSSLLYSAIGDPYRWGTIDGAGEIATGDTITNFIIMPGNQQTGTLGVYCRNNTSILYGNSAATWSLVHFNTGTGAIDYTAQNMSDAYVMGDRGVTTMQTTLNFGNFSSATLTNNIRTFIESKRSKVAYSTLMRTKSQYRLFFTDGYGLYMTIVNGKLFGSMPVFFPNAAYCAWGGTISTGEEISYFGAASGGYVYQLDVGSSFDGANLDAYITPTWDMVGSPRMLKQFRHASVEVSGSSYAAFQFGYQLAYSSSEIPQSSPVSYDSSFQSATPWDTFVWDFFTWDGGVLAPTDIDITGCAENIQPKISSTTNYIMPYSINSIIWHYTPRRGLR